MKSWKEVVVSPQTSLAEAIAKVDASGLQVALVLAPEGTLLGLLTDGNIRRAILAGRSLQVSVSEVMETHPITVPASTPRDVMLALMQRNTIHHLPLVNDLGNVVGLATLDDLVGAAKRPNWIVLMAGGLGTRLQPLTNECPKPLLAVSGKAILDTIIESFAEQGFKHIFISVNYKAEMIQNHVGKGERWGIEVEYLHETIRLGTAGSLSLLPGRPTTPILVMNGDVLTRANFSNLLQFHEGQGAIATMAVREFAFQVPYGVVQVNGTQIDAIEEKPVEKFFVNAGIYVLSPDVLQYLPKASFCDMPTLFQNLIADHGNIAAYPLREYWLDIGHLEELDRAQREWVRVPR